jgi:transposase InsO family protein
MPWQEVSTVSLRQEFVSLASREDATIRALCRRFGISPQTGYTWLRRYQAAGPSGLVDRSRRPRSSPRQTPAAVEAAVLALRDEHPTWGGRKLAAVLRARGAPAPHPATITAILRRHGRLGPPDRRSPPRWQRFEQVAANQLWQMDFKGHFALGASGARCHPLTVLDDHSRFALGVLACADESGPTVQACLTRLFRRYGLPDRMLMDNGSPWGSAAGHAWTPLGVWLLRLGIGVQHGRAYHPQTQGKDERFHRTLQADVLQGRVFGDLPAAQAAFDTFRQTYNHLRPHEACGLQPPSSRYQVSARPFPAALPPIEYDHGLPVRRVQQGGRLAWQGRQFRVPRAFRGYPVALRPTAVDQTWTVYFLRYPIATLDLRQPTEG